MPLSVLKTHVVGLVPARRLLCVVLIVASPGFVRADVASTQPSGDLVSARLTELGTRQGELRTLLDDMLKKSSRGTKGLGPEPDARTKLPEESSEMQVADEELDAQLLGQGSAAAPGADDMKPAEKSLALVGDRMARARQRLAVDHDPGTTTQIIQDRILKDLDILIEQANQQSKAGKSGKSKPDQKPGQPKPGQGEQPNNTQAGGPKQPNESKEGAKESTLGDGGPAQTATGEEIKEKMTEWGGTTPRQREAVIEGSSETVVEKYKKLVDDYYRSLATQANQKR